MKHSKINGMLLQRFTVKPCLVKYFKWLLKVIMGSNKEVY